jgi:hypothetical protein
MFPMIFQNLIGPKNHGMMIPSGTTQANFYPQGNNMALTLTKVSHQLLCGV